MPEEIRDQEKSSLNYQDVIRIAVLYWKWFLLSVIICVGIAAVYLRYTTPVYQATTKMLIKNDDNNARSRTGSRIAQAANLGFMEASDGFDNEMEILTSRLLAEQAARDLKLYTTYYIKGKIKAQIAYHNNPVNVDVDPTHLEMLKAPVKLTIKYENGQYNVTGTYTKPLVEGTKGVEYKIDKKFKNLPATFGRCDYPLTQCLSPDARRRHHEGSYRVTPHDVIQVSEVAQCISYIQDDHHRKTHTQRRSAYARYRLSAPAGRSLQPPGQ